MTSALVVALVFQAVLLPVRSIDKGAMSGCHARQVTVSDRETWAACGASTRGEMVAAVSRDVRAPVSPVEIVGYHEEGGQIVVQYRETTPRAGAITAQVIVSPYHLVALPKRAGTLTFEKLTARR